MWATTALNDPIQYVAMIGKHGGNPMDIEYGARIYQSWIGTAGGFSAHSEYWTDGNLFRSSTALIIVGWADCDVPINCLVPWAGQNG